MRTTHIGLTFLFLLFSLSPFPAVCQSAAKAPSPAMDQQTIDVLNSQAKDAMKKGAFGTALKLFTLTAKEGSPEGELWLAEMYMSGSGVTKSYAHAVIYLKQAASKGYPRAMGALGVMYFNGFGVPVDKKLGRQWMQKAADAGDGIAKAELIQLDAATSVTATKVNVSGNGGGIAPLLHTWKDPSTRLTWTDKDSGADLTWQQAVDYCQNLHLAGKNDWRLPTIDELKQLNDVTAALPGTCCSGQQKVQYHIKKYIHLSESGIEWSSTDGSDSNSKMDFLFSFSKGMPGTSNVSDPARRALCVRSEVATIAASKSNSPPAASLVKQGDAFYTQSNYTEALKYYQPAAEMGDQNAQANLGYMYEMGWGGDTKLQASDGLLS